MRKRCYNILKVPSTYDEEGGDARWNLVATYTLETTGSRIRPLNDDCLHIGLLKC